MKRILKTVGVVMAMMCLAGCNENQPVKIGDMSEAVITTTDVKVEETTTEEETVKYTEFKKGNSAGIRYSGSVFETALSAEGVIYYQLEDRKLHIRPIDSSDDKVLCYKPDCMHSKIHATDTEADCMAATYGGSDIIGYYEGKIYYFTGIGMECSVYRMDVETGKRELFTKLPYGAYNSGARMIFCGDNIYCVMTVESYREKVDGENVRIDYEGLIEISLIDGSYRIITSGSTDHVVRDFYLGDSKVYLIKYDGTDYESIYISQIDLYTLEEKEVLSPEMFDDLCKFIEACDDDSFYCYDMMDCDICIRNVNGTKERTLVKGADGEQFRKRSISNNGIFYARSLDYEDEPAGQYFMDMITGEVTNITDVANLYNLFQYDGYYDVFIGMNAADLSMYSRERILSEAKAQ